MKKEKIIFICFIVASMCYYVISIVNYFNKNKTGAAIFLCLGSTFLCLSTIYQNRHDNDSDEK